MSKLQTIIYDAAVGVRKEMAEAIFNGAKGMHFEKVYGDAYVDIDIFLEFKDNYVFEVKEVMISHCDTQHKSPLLEKAIYDVLPNWFDMYENIKDETRLTA